MRLLEVSNLDTIIPNEYYFLQVHYDYMDSKFYIISINNKNIKVISAIKNTIASAKRKRQHIKTNKRQAQQTTDKKQKKKRS